MGLNHFVTSHTLSCISKSKTLKQNGKRGPWSKCLFPTMTCSANSVRKMFAFGLGFDPKNPLKGKCLLPVSAGRHPERSHSSLFCFGAFSSNLSCHDESDSCPYSDEYKNHAGQVQSRQIMFKSWASSRYLIWLLQRWATLDATQKLVICDAKTLSGLARPLFFFFLSHKWELKGSKLSPCLSCLKSALLKEAHFHSLYQVFNIPREQVTLTSTSVLKLVTPSWTLLFPFN